MSCCDPRNMLIVFKYLLLLLSTFVPQISSHPILVVISFDGFRNDYINQSLTPNLYKLGQNGATGHMRSSFVTKTYPNHQTIATGYYEEIHGITNNEMFDPKFNETFDVDKSADKWWTEGPQLPIWMVNQMVRGGEPRFSGSMQWPGGHVHYRNQSIKYLQEYEENHPMTWSERIDKIIEWMSDNPKNANCVFAYFSEPDAQAHLYGPFSQQVIEQIKRADQIIGYLLKRLEEKSLLSRTNLIVLSDHGMAEISEDRVISLNTFLDKSLYTIAGSSPVWSILPKPDYEIQVFQTLLNASKTMNFTVYKKEDIPREFHYNNHRRILPIFIMADEGWDIYQQFNKSWLNGTTVWGNHGYNNSLPSMRPLFIASGPAFKSGYYHKKPFPNVDLFPLMLNVLQLFPAKNYPSNGSFSNVYDLLIPPIYSGDYDSSAQKWFTFILYVFGGIGVLFFGSICLICGTNLGKSIRRKQRPPDIVWDSMGSGLDIDLRSHLDPNFNDFSKPFTDEDIVSRAKRLQRPEETLLLLQDDDEEDL